MQKPQIKEIHDPYKLNENMKRNEIAIIMPTFNQYEATKKNILLIKQQTLIPDIIIVDNNSTDNTFEKLKNEFPDIILIKTKDNYGGAGGFYLGQKYAYEKGYKYIILNDNDAYPVDKDLIECLIKEKKNYKSAVAPLGYFGKLVKNYDKVFPFHFLTVDRKIVESIGFVNWKYFLKIDDMDYSYRISKFFGDIKIIDKKYFHPLKHNFNLFRYFDKRNGFYKDIIIEKNFFKKITSFIKKFILLNVLDIFFIILILKKKKINLTFLKYLFYYPIVHGMIKKLNVDNKRIISEIIKESRYDEIKTLDPKDNYVLYINNTVYHSSPSEKIINLLKYKLREKYNIKDQNLFVFIYNKNSKLKNIFDLIKMAKYRNLIILSGSFPPYLYPIICLFKKVYFVNVIDNFNNIENIEWSLEVY